MTVRGHKKLQSDTKCSFFPDVELTNRFHGFQEDHDLISTELKQDEVKPLKMFVIGSRCIFKQRRYKAIRISRSTADNPNRNNEEIPKSKRKPNRLSYFYTKNRFEALSDNQEEDIDKLIQRIKVLSARKKSLRKCRSCNFKKRQCILNPSLCTASHQFCSLCGKVGHFPQSLCCQKRRKSHFQKHRKSEKVHPRKLSKRNLKLINMRIKQLELQKERKNLIQLAEKCAKKFQDKKVDQKQMKLIEYCNKNLQKLLNIKSFPCAEVKSTMQNILNIFDQMYYNKDESLRTRSSSESSTLPDIGNSQQAAYDEEASTEELSSEGECLNLNQLDDQDEISECNTYNMSDWMIPQLDGLDDEALNINEIFTIKCESIELIQMMNFLRSFDLLWELNDAHNLCSFKENCFFCHMRSSFLRLTEERTMGPKGKKLNEIVSQLGQYEQKLYIHWRSLLTNVPLLVENTMKLLESDAFNPNPYFGIPSGQCQQCRFAFNDENKIFYDVSSVSVLKIKEVPMEHIIKLELSWGSVQAETVRLQI